MLQLALLTPDTSTAVITATVYSLIINYSRQINKNLQLVWNSKHVSNNCQLGANFSHPIFSNK